MRPPEHELDDPEPWLWVTTDHDGASGLARLRRRGLRDVASIVGHEAAGLVRHGLATRSRGRERARGGYHGNESARYRTIHRGLAMLLDPTYGPVPQGTLLDVGCGMGRVLRVAAAGPWPGPVMGLDRDPVMVEAARRACRRFDVTVVEGDATTTAIPAEVDAVFLFNPFGPRPMAVFAERIAESLEAAPRPLRILYPVPEHVQVLRAPWPEARLKVVRDLGLLTID